MKLLYLSYELNNFNNYLAKAEGLDESIVRKTEHLAKELIKRDSLNYPLAIKMNDGFVFTRINNNIIYFIYTNDNPYLYLDSSIISVDKSFITINRLKPRQATLNSLDEDSYLTIENIVQALIDNIDNNEDIYLDSCSEDLLKLILSLIPRSYLDYIEYSGRLDTKIRLNKRGSLYFNLRDSAINNRLDIKRYAYTIVDNLKISLDNAIIYRKSIEELIEKKNISIESVCDLLNLIDGKLERINSLEKLSLAVGNLEGMDYNRSYVGTIIFTNLNKYPIAREILPIYRLVYENVTASHTYIIESFLKNINLFCNLDGLGYLGYLDEILYKVPFPLIDLLGYLKEKGFYNSFFFKSFNSFNESYLLLDLICQDLKENNGVIVPNEELLYYLDYYIKGNLLDELDIVLKRIERLNKRAPERLLRIAIERLIKSGELKSLGLDLTFRTLERLTIDEFIHYFKRLYLVFNRLEFIDKLNERENRNRGFYQEAMSELKKDIEGSEIVDQKETRRLYKEENLSLEELTEYYNSYYLDKRKNDNGVFIDKLMGFLEENKSIALAIEVYNKFYRELEPSYKDVLSSVRRINDFIFSFHKEIYNNVSKYIEVLDSINDKLNASKEGANPYYGLLKIGEGLREGPEDLKRSIIKDLSGFNALSSYSANELSVFMKYYLNDLLYEYFEYLISFYDDYTFISSFRAILDPFSELEGFSDGILSYFKENKYNQGDLFYLILASSNIQMSKYKRVALLVLDKLGKKDIKKYFNDYLSYLSNATSINYEYRRLTKAFIMEYIENNLSFISRLLLKLKNR